MKTRYDLDNKNLYQKCADKDEIRIQKQEEYYTPNIEYIIDMKELERLTKEILN